MKTLVIIWVVAGIVVVGSIVYMNRTINSLAREIQSDTLYVRQDSDLYVTNNYGNQLTARMNVLQPMVADNYYQFAYNAQPVGLNQN